ncbi:MAG: hypothetical protein QNJ45_08845 [Ardenticatenaceae bacterium]|nr:hypothetical protein [Ardenticatenaceae bacterium]
MNFSVDKTLIRHAQEKVNDWDRLYWMVGGAGSGKTTICRALSEKYGIPIYDMDAHIYGAYHGRFSPERHPVNSAWSAAPNGLAWLLEMSWNEYETFNRAALPEYLDLLTVDLPSFDPQAGLLIDGGLINPGLLTQVISPKQIICLAAPDRSSEEIWAENSERRAMKAMIDKLPGGEGLWQKFLEFDTRITQTIIKESRTAGIPICLREASDSVSQFAAKVADVLGFESA